MAIRKYQEEGQNSSAQVINQLVANQGVLFVKLYQYHWFVKGPEFFRLHDKFEELYNETIGHFDTFAERLVTIGEKPYSTLGEFLEAASISEKPYDNEISAEDMVSNLVDDFKTIREITSEGIRLAGDENDTVTEDMLIGYKEGIDQHIWMLEAFLGK